jgi:anti-anti-sigma factor
VIKHSQERTGEHVVIQASSYLTGRTAESLEKTFDKNLGEGRKSYIIDFKETEIINSIGISMLIGIIEKVMEQDGAIYFKNLSQVNEEIFQMMGLLRYAPLIRD